MSWGNAICLSILAAYAPFAAMTEYVWRFDHQNFPMALKCLPLGPALVPTELLRRWMGLSNDGSVLFWFVAATILATIVVGPAVSLRRSPVLGGVVAMAVLAWNCVAARGLLGVIQM